MARMFDQVSISIHFIKNRLGVQIELLKTWVNKIRDLLRIIRLLMLQYIRQIDLIIDWLD